MLRMAGGARKWCGVFGILTLALALSSPSAAAGPELNLLPNTVDIGTFYDGATVVIKGTIPQGTNAVVEVVGSEAAVHLLRKGRRAGLWMSVGEIEVTHAPSLYMLLSSSPKIPELTGKETPWGYAALSRQVKFRGKLTAGEQGKFFDEFMGLKKDELLYRLLPGALKTGAPREGQVAISGKLPLPAKVPRGQYQVRLAVVKDGRLLAQKDTSLTVKMVGFPAWLFTMAQQQGALYGVLAVVIAIVTGFIMGVLFKGKTEH